MSSLPDVKNEKDYLEYLRFSDNSVLSKTDIKKILETNTLKTKEDIIEFSGIVEVAGIKSSIKFLQNNLNSDFKNIIKKSAVFKEARRKYFLDLTAPLRKFSNVEEGATKCPKCGSKKVKVISEQTRAGDEGSTETATCVCGNTWKLNN